MEIHQHNSTEETRRLETRETTLYMETNGDTNINVHGETEGNYGDQWRCESTQSDRRRLKRRGRPWTPMEIHINTYRDRRRLKRLGRLWTTKLQADTGTV